MVGSEGRQVNESGGWRQIGQGVKSVPGKQGNPHQVDFGRRCTLPASCAGSNGRCNTSL